MVVGNWFKVAYLGFSVLSSSCSAYYGIKVANEPPLPAPAKPIHVERVKDLDRLYSSRRELLESQYQAASSGDLAGARAFDAKIKEVSAKYEKMLSDPATAVAVRSCDDAYTRHLSHLTKYHGADDPTDLCIMFAMMALFGFTCFTIEEMSDRSDKSERKHIADLDDRVKDR